MGDAHCVVIDDVSEVICRESVCLKKDLIVKVFIRECDVTVYKVMVRSGTCKRHLLSDNVGNAGIKVLLYLFFREVSAVTVITCAFGSVLLQCLKALLGAEASVSLALGNELLGIGLIHIESLALNIRAVFAANVRSFVVLKTCELHGVIYNLSSTFNITFTVSILYSEDKCAAFMFCCEIFIQCGTKVADVHKTCRAGCKSRSYFHT